MKYKYSQHRADAYFVLDWYNRFGTLPYYENIPNYVIVRAFKNRKRWNKPNSLYSKLGFYTGPRMADLAH